VKQLKLFDIPEPIQAQAFRVPPIRLKTVTVLKQIKLPKVEARVTRGYIYPLIYSKDAVAQQEQLKLKQIQIAEETGTLLPSMSLDIDLVEQQKVKQKYGMSTLQTQAVVQAQAYQPIFMQPAITQAQLQKQLIKQAQREGIKQKQRIKQLEKLKPKIPKVPILKPEFEPSPLLISALKKIKKKVKGFETFAKVKGEWIKIGKKPLPKYKAIQLGEKYVGKLSLAAQFKVLPKGFVFGIEKPYTPSKEFRPYKIRKKVKVPLEDRWIERAEWRLEKKGREAELIQRAKTSFFKTPKSKKKSKGGFKWF